MSLQRRAMALSDATGTAPVKVVFLLAWGRSGSTILDNALGEIDGFFSAGEIRYLWERGVAKGWRCGCGRPVSGCPVWSKVLAGVAGDGVSPELQAARVLQWQRRLVRIRHTWRLLRARSGMRHREEVERYGATLSRLFRVTATVARASVIVDSSKRPSDAAMLRLAHGVQLYAVHLVRDPRAVAYSWGKRNARVGRHGVITSTASWVVWNLAAEAVRRRLGPRGLFLRYEDFVDDPRGSLQAILQLAGEDHSMAPPIDEDVLDLSTNHTVSGNPSRFRTGPVSVRSDSRWVRELDPLRWWVATLLSLPLLRRYGYRVRRATAARA